MSRRLARVAAAPKLGPRRSWCVAGEDASLVLVLLVGAGPKEKRSPGAVQWARYSVEVSA